MIKSLIVGLFSGSSSYITFVISIFGSVLSLIGMVIFKKTLPKSRFTPFIGLIGGFLHPIGQFIGVMVIYGYKEFFASSIIKAPIMLIMGVITGIIVGLSSKKINELLKEKVN